MASSSTLKLSDFTIKKKLGEGSYSQVSLVTRNADQLPYALKQVSISRLNEKERENALNEVRFLASIRHKNIIGYRAAFLDEPSQTLCIVMEYANDGDLLGKVQDMRKKGIQFAEGEIWRIFIQLAQGLQCLHEMKIMHRDLKPANVFLWKGQNGEGDQNQITVVAKIGDMNVSKLAQHNGLNYTQTGTPYYASPEVWRDQPYDFKSDVWSLGCILYEITALKAPFQAQDMDNLFKKVIKGSYQKIPGIFSNELHNMIRAMLTVDPSQRPSIYQVLSMPCVISRMEKMFPEDTPPNQSIQSQNSTNKKPQYSSRLLLKGNGTQSCGQLLSTIRDTKDLKLLKNQLPKSNFESEIVVVNSEKKEKAQPLGIITKECLDLPLDAAQEITETLKDNKKLRKNSANRTKTSQQQQQNSSVSLLARNQSQKILLLNNQSSAGIIIKDNKTSRQQLLPSLQPNKELLMIQQRIRESSQVFKKSKSKLNYAGRAAVQSRNDTNNVNQSFNSITQDQPEGTKKNEQNDREILSNSHQQLNQSIKQRLNGLERARSEQRLLNNVNTPSYNLLPLLGVVNEVIIPPTSNKKMNLKQQTSKRISKQQANAPSLLSNSKAIIFKPLSPSQKSPQKQYGTTTLANPSQQNSLNTSIIKNQVVVAASKLNSTKQRRDSSVLSQRLNYDISNRLLPHPKLVGDNKYKKDTSNQDIANLKLQMPFNYERQEESPNQQKTKTRPPQVIEQYLKSDSNSQENSPKVLHRSNPVATNSQMRKSQEHQGYLEKSSQLTKNIISMNQMNHHYYHINQNNTDVNSSLNYDLIPHHNESKLGSLIGINQPKIKPVKVIPSSRRKKEQLLASLQSSANDANTIRETQLSPLPYQPIAAQNSQLNSLKPSSSNITLLPIQSVRGKTTQASLINSQQTTVTAQRELNHYNQYTHVDEKSKMPSNSILQLNPSLSKPLLMPLRQQLYMDERNPFLDDQALNKVRQDTKTNRNSQKNSLLNYSEMMIDQYSTKNSQRNHQNLVAPNIVYQLPAQSYQRLVYHPSELQQSTSSGLLQANLSQKSSQFMHRRNNSSFDYSDPSHKFLGSQQPAIINQAIQQRSQSKANPTDQLLLPSSQQLILNQIMGQQSTNQRSTSRTNQYSEEEGMAKRKNRIGLLEKARKVLINQSSSEPSHNNDETYDPHYFSRGLSDNHNQGSKHPEGPLQSNKSNSQMMLISQN